MERVLIFGGWRLDGVQPGLFGFLAKEGGVFNFYGLEEIETFSNTKSADINIH